MKIGLTGSIACGKSGISSYLRELGYTVADADAISHSLTSPGGIALPALYEAFGSGIFCGDRLDRAALGRLVFGDSAARSRLNAILHPLILAQIDEILSAADPDALLFADIPLLYECGMQDRFDRIWVAAASRQTQIARLYTRDGLSPAQAEARIDAQMPLEVKMRLCDAVITTDGPVEDTRRQVRRLLADPLQRRQP